LRIKRLDPEIKPDETVMGFRDGVAELGLGFIVSTMMK
jgi:hypothetical protein